MSDDILSQEEVQALSDTCREAQASGKSARRGPEDREVNPYDFASPTRFTREHLSTLAAIHAKYASSLSGRLSSILMTNIQAESLGVEQTTYESFCSSLPEDSLPCEVSLAPISETAIFEFNHAMAGRCIDCLTGGPSEGISDVPALTDIDRAIMGKLLESLLICYKDIWAPYAGMEPEVKGTGRYTSKHTLYTELLPAKGRVLVFGFEVKMGDVGGSMSVCMPVDALDSVASKLTTARTSIPEAASTPETRQAIQKSLADVEVACKAVLGHTRLTLGDVVSLEVGDVVKLDAKAESDVEFWVAGTQIGTGTPGLVGKSVGVRLNKTTTPDADSTNRDGARS